MIEATFYSSQQKDIAASFPVLSLILLESGLEFRHLIFEMVGAYLLLLDELLDAGLEQVQGTVFPVERFILWSGEVLITSW